LDRQLLRVAPVVATDMIEITDMTKVYKMGDNVVQALRGASLKIEDGDFVAIMGPSGSGKSTLTHILGLLDVPTSGSYKLNEREVSNLSEDELAIFRREEIGFIFQQFNLLPRMDARENVALPLLYSHKEAGDLPQQLLEKVGLGPRSDHRPNELSGGQQQRVAIARSLVNQPRMILADEPTGNLDSVSEREILGILKDLNNQGITIIIVTHEEEVGAQAKRLIRMRDGVIHSDERIAPLHATHELPSSEPPAETTPSLVRELFEHFRQGYRTLAGNKVRTALSMLGILIGVAAVVAMLALGRGAQKAIESQLSSLGSNLLVLRPGSVRVGGVSQEAGTTTRLTAEDANALKAEIPTIRAVVPTVNGRAQVTYLNKNWSSQITGVTPDYADVHAAVPTVGRFFSDEENRTRSRVAVIGMTIVKELFGTQNPIGEMIKINRVSFQVIGIAPEKGATGWRDQDEIVILPVTTAMYRLLGKEYVDSIDIEVRNATDIETTQDAVTDTMYARKHVAPSQVDAFQIRNMADIQAALSQSSKTMSTLLATIAAISLLVGGIGIMNIMLVSVTERTKEIGLRKAVGGRRRDILLQFLAESVVVSVIGGVIGIILGWSITVILSSVSGWATSVSPDSIVISFGFSAFIGIVFGIYPARKASLLHPIDALRYE
jgi:macrolide transport system ATP-binding/permease protein